MVRMVGQITREIMRRFVMKLKCVRAEIPGFTEDHIYEVSGVEFEIYYFVKNDMGQNVSVPLDGALWEFEIVQEGEQDMQQKSGPKFGDIVHVNGNKYLFILIDEDGDYKLVGSEGETYYVQWEEIDEYKPDPEQELRQRILNDWCSQSLDLAFDTEVCRVECSVGQMIDFIVEHKDKW